MANDDVSAVAAEENTFTNPWPALLAGLFLNLVALGCLYVLKFAIASQEGGGQASFVAGWFGNDFKAPQLLPVLVLIGLITTAVGVVIRPQSPVVLGVAAMSGLVACGAMRIWDSAQLFLAVLSAFTAFAAFLMVLPRVARRVIVSLMIVFHFGGILTAVTSVPPQPWLSSIVWTCFYRPYLEFMYLNNAYHFYSPEPGHGAMVWFYVKYADDTGRWFKIPNYGDNPLVLEYQRRLSLAESVNQLTPPGPVPFDLESRRRLTGARQDIPLHPDIAVPLQFRVPLPFSKRMLETYARHVARTVKHPTDTTIAVVGVRIYRVVHQILTPKEMASGEDPTDLIHYYPYYQGEFTLDGRLKDPADPYLYWLIPIVKVPVPVGGGGGFRVRIGRQAPQEEKVMNYLEEHIKLESKIADSALDSPIPGGDAGSQGTSRSLGTK
jgi:hypothetical protein